MRAALLMALVAACGSDADGQLRPKEHVVLGDLNSCNPDGGAACVVTAGARPLCAVLHLASGERGPACVPDDICQLLTCGRAPWVCVTRETAPELWSVECAR